MLFNRLAAAANVLVRGAGAMAFGQFLGMMSARRDGGTGQPYNQVVPVRVCVDYISQSIAGLPLRVSTADDQVIESGPLAAIVTRPNAAQGMADFVADTVAYKLLFGRYHFRATGSTVMDVQVETINPLQLSPINEGGVLAGWRYTAMGGGQEMLGLDEVHTVVATDYHNPTQPWEGVSPARAAGLAIAQYYESDRANLSSLQNDVQPAGALTTEQNLTEDQERSLRGQLTQEHAGSRNRRRIMLLQGGLKWEQMASTFAEMEFTAGRAMSREDICASFGLKAILFFGQAGAGMNDDQARSAAVQAHQSVIRPVARRVAEEFTCAVLDRLTLDRSLTLRDGLRGDWRRVAMTGGQCRHAAYRAARKAAVAQDRRVMAWFDDTGEAITTEIWQQQAAGAKTWFEMGVPLNDILDATDAPFENRPHGDIPRVPMGMVDARDYEQPGQDDLDGSVGVEPAAELGEPAEDPASQNPAAKGVAADAERGGLTEAQLASVWLRMRAQVAGVERQMVGPYSRHLMAMRSQVLARLAELDPGTAVVGPLDAKQVSLHYTDVAGAGRCAVVTLSLQQRVLLGELLFDLREATRDRWAAVGRFVKTAVGVGGQDSMDQAAAAEGASTPATFDMKNEGAVAAVRRRKFAIAGLTNDQRDRLRAVMATGLAEGKTTQELADTVRKQFNVEAKRAKLVATQESGAAVEEGRQEGRVQAGVPMKSWLWSRKEKGRAQHAATEKATLDQPIPVDQDFMIAGTNITCPHPRATGIAEQDIHCGCTTMSRYPGDQVRDARVLRFVAGISKRTTERTERTHV